MAALKKRVGQRVQRTRQMLQESFIQIAHEKGIAAATIQEITERADVNRGTFYLHFADKYELLATIIREHFKSLLTSTLPPGSRWDRRSLHLFIQAMLEDFERKYPRLLLSREYVPLIERATCEELATLLLMWLKQDESVESRGPVSLEMMAKIASWTIFGAAVQWSQEVSSVSSEQRAYDVLLVITEGLARLAPGALAG